MKKNTIMFVAVLGLVATLGVIYFLNKNNSSRYTAPVNVGTPTQTKPADNRLTDSAGNPIKGEFGDPVYEGEPIQAPVVEKKIVKGSYFYSEDSASQYAGKICFRANTTTQGVAKTFCLDNADEAFAVLGISKGFGDGLKKCIVTAAATIEVKNYTKLTGDADGYDRATLTSLITSGEQTNLPCGEY
jgi:Co/Zn/Cd efflux system component